MLAFFFTIFFSHFFGPEIFMLKNEKNYLFIILLSLKVLIRFFSSRKVFRESVDINWNWLDGHSLLHPKKE